MFRVKLTRNLLVRDAAVADALDALNVVGRIFPCPWYVPNEANRNSCHRIKVGEDLVLALKPGETQSSTVKSADETGGKQASLVHRDTDSQQLIIKQWIVDTPALSVKVAPLTGPVSLPKHP